MESFWRYIFFGQFFGSRQLHGYGDGCTRMYGYGQCHVDTAYAFDRKHLSYPDILLWRSRQCCLYAIGRYDSIHVFLVTIRRKHLHSQFAVSGNVHGYGYGC